MQPVTFVVKESGAKEKAGGIRLGRIVLESANSKGCSKVQLIGDEDLKEEFRLGEFYEVSLKQVKAPE